VKFDEIEIELQYPRVEELGNVNTGYTFGICVGSDILKYFVLTIDRTNNNDVLIIHK
jgi:hypothetical protein